LVLGDNIFYGHGLVETLSEPKDTGATVFAYHVSDPERYGVVEFDDQDKAISIEEKPKKPKSNWAVTGLYFYDQHAPSYAAQLKPSSRGELEITDLNRIYLEKQALSLVRLGRGFAWLDTGTPQSLLEASEYVHAIERRQGQSIACLEEIAFHAGWINKEQLKTLGKNLSKNSYGLYILRMIEEY